MKTKSLTEEVLSSYSIEFGSRTYGLDASVTEMLFGPKKPISTDLGSGSGIGSGPSFKLGVTKKSFKIFDEEKGDEPLIRIDKIGHHGKPKNHLQHGMEDYFGRHGDEAYDILGEIFKKNTKIKMPWEK